MKQNPKANIELDFVIELLEDISEEQCCSDCLYYGKETYYQTCKECRTAFVLSKYQNYINRDKIITENKRKKTETIAENRIKNKQTRKELEEISKYVYIVHELHE